MKNLLLLDSAFDVVLVQLRIDRLQRLVFKFHLPMPCLDASNFKLLHPAERLFKLGFLRLDFFSDEFLNTPLFCSEAEPRED